MDQLGPNALGEVLESGRVTDCYLGLLLPPGPVGEPEAGTILVVGPAALLHAAVPQPAGSLVYALLTGHPEREPGELVFVADLTCELRAWPADTWAKVGVDPEQVAQAVVSCWQAGEVTGLQVDDLSFEAGSGRAGHVLLPVRTAGTGRRRAVEPQVADGTGSQTDPQRPVGKLAADRQIGTGSKRHLALAWKKASPTVTRPEVAALLRRWPATVGRAFTS